MIPFATRFEYPRTRWSVAPGPLYILLLLCGPHGLGGPRHDQRTDSSSVAPHSRSHEFLPQIERYREIVEEALFDRLGRPSFFAEAVEMVMGRIAARIKGEHTSETANGKSSSCAFAPQENGIRELAQEESFGLRRGIELQFVKTRILDLPPDCRGSYMTSGATNLPSHVKIDL